MRLDCRKCGRRAAFRAERARSREVPNAAPVEAPARVETPRRANPSFSRNEQPAAPASRPQTTIPPGLFIRGDLHSKEDIRVCGHLEGTVDVGECGLVIESGAKVAATVKAGYVVVHGLLHGGTITAARITLCRDGSFIGQCSGGSLVVEEGAYLQGELETSRGT